MSSTPEELARTYNDLVALLPNSFKFGGQEMCLIVYQDSDGETKIQTNGGHTWGVSNLHELKPFLKAPIEVVQLYMEVWRNRNQ